MAALRAPWPPPSCPAGPRPGTLHKQLSHLSPGLLWMPLLSVRADPQEPISSHALPSALSDQAPILPPAFGDRSERGWPWGHSHPVFCSRPSSSGAYPGTDLMVQYNRPVCGRGSPGANETVRVRTIDACISCLLSRPHRHPLGQGPPDLLLELVPWLDRWQRWQRKMPL